MRLFRNFGRQPLLRETTAALVALGAAIALAQVPVAGTNGAVDSDFGAITASGQSGAFGFAQNTMTDANGVGIQSSGKPIVVGSCGTNPSEDICISRLTRDGTQLDTTFGTAGTARFNGGGQDYGYAMTIDSSDRILIAGACSGSIPSACVLRYSANGQLDTTFGSGGRAGYASMIRLATLALDSDGRIVVGGECFDAQGTRACIGRLTPNGAIDSTFNTGNRLIVIFPTADYQSAASVALDASGRILLAAYCNAPFQSATYGRFCVTRITADGALDSTFNAGVPRTYALRSATTDCSSSSIAETASGQILVGGYCKNSNSVGVFAVSRLTASGGFDTSFGVDAYAGLTYQWIDREIYVGDARLYQDSQGRIVLAGRCAIGFCIGRMLPNGRTDALFADRGVLLYKPEPAFPAFEQSASAAMFFDGNRVLLAGVCARAPTDRRACVTRNYLEAPGERCSLDLDGDGEVSAATDGLLWTRWLAGFRGAALTAGAIGARAQRLSGESIGTYLATHCGLR